MGGKHMVGTIGSQETAAAQDNIRGFPRDAVRINADLLLSDGPRFKVWVLDLSPAGFRIETANHILLDHIVYLTIPGFQPLQARVAWNYKEQ